MSGERTAERIVGRYALYGEIASGGMATVHFGRLVGEAGFSRTVAIKRLHPQFARDPEFTAMFLDEARLAARVQHPNVVPILDVVSLGAELYLVMDYVQGESLARLIRAHREAGAGAPPTIAASIIAGVLHGLHAAHMAVNEQGEPLGIVHRDVSPENVLVGVDGVARVLDFGVAKARGRLQTTREGQIKGKIAYMAPEQLRSAPVDRRTDVYAASVVLWELLVGRRLFSADNEGALVMQVVSAEVTPPGHLVPGLMPALDAVVMRGLARDPAARFQSAWDMAVALEEVAGLASPRQVGEWVDRLAGGALSKRARQVQDIESVSRGGAAVEASSAPSQHTQVSSIAVSSASAAPGRGRFRTAAVAVAAAALGGLAAVLALTFGRGESPAPAAAGPAAMTPVEPSATAAPSPAPAADPPPPPSSAPGPSAAAVAPPPPDTAKASTPTAPTATSKRAGGASTGGGKTTGGGKAPASCNPPYTVDARGIRRIKPECM